MDDREYLEQEIARMGGFVGARMDESTIMLLERKLAEQKLATRIFYLIAVDSETASQTLIVPEERIVEARTFKRQIDAWNHVGARRIEEVESILITRFQHNSNTTHGAVTWRPSQSGDGCMYLPSTMTHK